MAKTNKSPQIDTRAYFGTIIYKHENNTDVAFEIIRTHYRDAKRIKLKIFWWNIVGNPYPLGIIENIEIKMSDWNNWKPKLLSEVKKENGQ